jgi:hypothetical protein
MGWGQKKRKEENFTLKQQHVNLKVEGTVEGSCLKLLYPHGVTRGRLTFLHYSSSCNGNTLSED